MVKSITHSAWNNPADNIIREMKAIFQTARTPSEVFTFDQGTYLQEVKIEK